MNYKLLLKKVTYLFIFMILFFTFFSKTINNLNSPRVKTISSKNGYLIQTVRGMGQFNPETSTRLYLPVPLIIDQVLVTPGEEIKKGTKLFRLNRDVVVAKYNEEYIQYYKTKVELDQISENLNQKNSNTFSFNELQKKLTIAAEDKSAKEDMFESGYITKKSLDEADLYLEQTQSEFNNANNRYINEKQSAERQIELLKMDLFLLEEKVEVLNQLKSDPVYRSTVDGKVLKILVNEGIILPKEQPVLSLISSDKSFVFKSKIETILTQDSQPGSDATIYFTGNRETESRLISISPNSDGVTSTLTFSVLEKDLNGNETGYFILRNKSAYYDQILPKRAIRGAGKSKFVYLAKEKIGAMSNSTILKKANVKILEESDNSVAISGNMTTTDKVVLDEDRDLLSEDERILVE